MNLIETYKKPIVMIALVVALARVFTNADFPVIAGYTQIVVSGVCVAGLAVFVLYYKEDEEPRPEQAKIRPSRPVTQPTTAASYKGSDLDISKVIKDAHSIAKGEVKPVEKKVEEADIFGGFR